MTSDAIPISVADTKRRFSDLLGAVRYQGARFIIERNGTPVAALVPLAELADQPVGQRGFLALVGKFSDAPELPGLLDEAVRTRGTQRSRPAPDLGS